jgi:hypothetical protein
MLAQAGTAAPALAFPATSAAALAQTLTLVFHDEACARAWGDVARQGVVGSDGNPSAPSRRSAGFSSAAATRRRRRAPV